MLKISGQGAQVVSHIFSGHRMDKAARGSVVMAGSVHLKLKGTVPVPTKPDLPE